MVSKRVGRRALTALWESLEPRVLLAANVTPVVSVAIKGQVWENGYRSATVTFTRTGLADVPLAVDFATGGDAVRDTDYTLSGDPAVLDGNHVTFAAGVKKVSLRLAGVDDFIMEPDESATITVEAGSGYVASPKPALATATTKIKNHNHVPTVASAQPGQIDFSLTLPPGGGSEVLPMDMLSALSSDPDQGTVLRYELTPATGVILSVNGKTVSTKTVLVVAGDTVTYHILPWGNIGPQAILNFRAFDGLDYSYPSRQITANLLPGPGTEAYDPSVASLETPHATRTCVAYNPVTGKYCRLLERDHEEPIPDEPNYFRTVSTVEYGERNDDGTWTSEDVTGSSLALYDDRSLSTFRVNALGVPEALAVSWDHAQATITRLQRDPVAGWQAVETAQFTADFGGGYATFDPAGRIVWTDPYNRRGVWENGQWTWQDLPDDIAGPIVEDPAGHLHMLYDNWVDHGSAWASISLGYATNAGGTWKRTLLQVVTGSGDAASYSSIALDPATGRPVVANWSVSQASTGSAKSSRLNIHILGANGKWVNQIVASKSMNFLAGDGERGTGYDPTLMFDSQGRATVFFMDFASQHTNGRQEWAPGQLRQATLVNGHWQIRTLFGQSTPFANHLSNYYVGLGDGSVLVSVEAELEPGGPFTAKSYLRSEFIVSGEI